MFQSDPANDRELSIGQCDIYTPWSNDFVSYLEHYLIYTTVGINYQSDIANNVNCL